MISKGQAKRTNRASANRMEHRAKSGTGISYGARNAGGASEHFEIGHGKHASHSSNKHQPGKENRRKTKEQRITSG